MVRLELSELKLIETLERRLSHLAPQIGPLDHHCQSGRLREYRALLWALEVIEAAAVNDCTEAFAYTLLRQEKLPERPARQICLQARQQSAALATALKD